MPMKNGLNPFAKKAKPGLTKGGGKEVDIEAGAAADAASDGGVVARKKKGHHMPLNKSQQSIVDRLVGSKTKAKAIG